MLFLKLFLKLFFSNVSVPRNMWELATFVVILLMIVFLVVVVLIFLVVNGCV